MGAKRKTHSTAGLKNWPATEEAARERGLDPRRNQQAVADWLLDGASLKSVSARLLAELGFSASQDTISRFFKAWQDDQKTAERKETLREIFDRADANAKAVGEMLAKRGSTVAQIAAAENLVFQLQATEEGKVDKAMWIELEKLRILRESAEAKGKTDAAKLAQKDKEIWIAMEKLLNEAAERLLDTATRARADEINASPLSHAAKIAAMRRHAFADVDALQKSGGVKLPE